MEHPEKEEEERKENEENGEEDGVMTGTAEGVLKVGWMVKKGGKFPSWRRRFFILRHGVLYY